MGGWRRSLPILYALFAHTYGAKSVVNIAAREMLVDNLVIELFDKALKILSCRVTTEGNKFLHRHYQRLPPCQGHGGHRGDGMVDKALMSDGIVRIPLQKTASLRSSLHYGPIKIGGQTFNVNFDTGSSNTWVLGRNCKSVLASRPRFDSSKSTTYEKEGRQFKLNYVTGPVRGSMGKDIVTLGHVDVGGQLFAEVNEVHWGGIGPLNCLNAFNIDKFDGIVGLGFKNRSAYNIPTPFENMIDQKLISEPVFAFYLQEDLHQKGELVLGGVDKSHYTGDLFDVPLVSETWWEVPLDAMDLGGEEAIHPSKSARALLDSGTSWICGPSHAVAALAKRVGAERVPGWADPVYSITCSSEADLPDLRITLRGKVFTLSPKEYILTIGGQCIFAFMGLDKQVSSGGDFWILGDIFLRKYYCIFDYDNRRVRIAPAVKRVSDAPRSALSQRVIGERCSEGDLRHATPDLSGVGVGDFVAILRSDGSWKYGKLLHGDDRLLKVEVEKNAATKIVPLEPSVTDLFDETYKHICEMDVVKALRVANGFPRKRLCFKEDDRDIFGTNH